MKEKINKIIEDLTEDVEIDTEALLELNENYNDENLEDEYYNTENTEEQLLAMIYLNKKFIKILEELKK